jgi:hypothetical protein
VLIATISSAAVVGNLAMKRVRQWQEKRWRYVSREEIESREPMKTPQVLVLTGIVEGREFEIVMRGFTNYFRKETWGAPKGQQGFLGGQKSGGFAVEVRTGTFSGQWQKGWQGTHGGGGGGGFEDYRDDLVPGRDLWSNRGFVGLSSKYERHEYVLNQQSHSRRWEEDFEGWMEAGEFRIPRKITWRESGIDYSSRWSRNPREFKVRTFKFQAEPSAEWFEACVKEYFPPNAIERTTNSQAKSTFAPTIN